MLGALYGGVLSILSFGSEQPPSIRVVSVDPCFRVDADEPDASPLKRSLPQPPRNPQGGHENRSWITSTHSLVALADSTNDVLSRRLDFYGYALALRSDCQAVYQGVSSSSRLHRDSVAMRAIVARYGPFEPPFVGQAPLHLTHEKSDYLLTLLVTGGSNKTKVR